MNIVQLCNGAENANLLLSSLDALIAPGLPVRPHIRYAPTIITAGTIVILAVHGRIAQPLHYNEFADGSAAFGIHHAADVFSNAGFAVVAIWGWLTLRPKRFSDQLRAGWPGYRLFLIGLFLTAFGSGFYHLAPDNARLSGTGCQSLWLAPACSSASAEIRSPD